MNKFKRPKIKIPMSNLEKILSILSVFFIITTWAYIISNWLKFPQQVPTHFTGLGKPDAWGGKNSLLILPIVSTIMVISLSILAKYPELYNYTVKITEENAERQYKNARKLIIWLNIEIALLFLYIESQSIQVGLGIKTGLGLWFTPAILVIVFGTIGVYTYRMFRLK